MNIHCASLAGKNLLDVVLGQLFDDLTEDLILQRFSLQSALKDLIGELIDRTASLRGVVAHVLHDRYDRVKGQTEETAVRHSKHYEGNTVNCRGY